MVAGASLLAACGQRSLGGADNPFRTATPDRILPVTQGTPLPTGTGAPDGALRLDQFLALSSVLTGVDNLDPGLGQIYLEALRTSAQSGSTLAEVYSAASSGSNMPQDLDALQQGGFFDQEGIGSLADKIIEIWYTGTYSAGEETHVVTYVDALAWKVLHFTKAPTTCGHFGFWSEEPGAEISPTFEYTPVPTPVEGN